MQRRMLAAMVAAALVCPASAEAQDEEVVLIRGMRVSPFVGFMTAFKRTEQWSFEEAGAQAFVQSEVDVAGGTTFGVQFEAPLGGRFGWQAAAGYATRGDTDFLVVETGEPYRVDGNRVIFLRGGAALHLHEEDSELVLRRLNASVFAGGVVMHERPRNQLGTADFLENGTHLGLNFGMNAEIPFGAERFAVQLGIEDNMLWFDESQLRSLAYAYFGSPGSNIDSTRASSEIAHTWLMRAGLQFRF